MRSASTDPPCTAASSARRRNASRSSEASESQPERDPAEPSPVLCWTAAEPQLQHVQRRAGRLCTAQPRRHPRPATSRPSGTATPASRSSCFEIVLGEPHAATLGPRVRRDLGGSPRRRGDLPAGAPGSPGALRSASRRTAAPHADPRPAQIPCEAAKRHAAPSSSSSGSVEETIVGTSSCARRRRSGRHGPRSTTPRMHLPTRAAGRRTRAPDRSPGSEPTVATSSESAPASPQIMAV